MPDSNRSLRARVWRVLTFEDVRTAESLEALSDFQTVRVSLLSFEGQRWYHQLLVFAVGVGLWIGTYAGIMHWLGWVEYATLDTTEALAMRRQAATGALVVAWAYYGVLWTQAYGGLMTNLFWFPTATIVFMPRSVLGLFVGVPEQRYAAGGLTGAPVQWSADAITMLAVGILPFFLLVIAMAVYWTYAGERGHRHRLRWHRQLPDIVLRDVSQEDWEDFGPELQQVHLDAGYEPEDSADSTQASSPDSERDRERPGPSRTSREQND